MQQRFSWKVNLCYDTKVYYYKHIIKVVLQQILPDYINFPDRKNSPTFGIFPYIFLTILLFPNFSRFAEKVAAL